MMKGGMGNMLKQMQQQMQKQQEEFAQREFTGQAGAGQVSITLTGAYQTRRVRIAPELVGEDVEILEDLIGAAINDAMHQIASAQQAQMGQFTGNLPFKMPF